MFFDDGYAQYGGANQIHKVYEQSKNVWDDIHPDSQDFIREYLQQYPEVKMTTLFFCPTFTKLVGLLNLNSGPFAEVYSTCRFCCINLDDFNRVTLKTIESVNMNSLFQRPMVRLQKGQIIKTEWNGQW